MSDMIENVVMKDKIGNVQNYKLYNERQNYKL